MNDLEQMRIRAEHAEKALHGESERRIELEETVQTLEDRVRALEKEVSDISLFASDISGDA